jgi:hypothetical protein
MFDAGQYLKDRGYQEEHIRKICQQAEKFFCSLERALGRSLTDLEKRKLTWLATDEHETVEVFGKMFDELALFSRFNGHA